MSGAALAVLAAAALVSAGASSALSPNDPAWPQEWGPRVTRAADMWERTTGDPRVVIAVVDTGVTPIADLQQALVPGWNFVDGNANTEDTEGHGTWVASTIAARGNNNIDAAGYCWRCSVMPVRVSDGHAPASTTNIARGIVWAVDHGARIINVSLDGTGSDPDEEAAVDYASTHNVLVVAAAGNSGDATLRYPAAFPSVLAVAGTDERNALYSWSTRGDWVNIAGPGCATVVDANVGVAYGCGSSFAPAAVAGIAGLLFSISPSLTAARVSDALRSTAHPVAGIGGGTVDAFEAARALNLINPPTTTSTAPRAAHGFQVSTIKGLIAGTRVLNVRTGRGTVEMHFRSAARRSCELELRVGRQIVVATGGPRTVTLHARTTEGPHRLRVTCTPVEATRFQLTIAGPVTD
jgi:thermitase